MKVRPFYQSYVKTYFLCVAGMGCIACNNNAAEHKLNQETIRSFDSIDRSLHKAGAEKTLSTDSLHTSGIGAFKKDSN